MRKRVTTFSFWTALFFTLSCGRATSTYPSYERAIAKVNGADESGTDAASCDPEEETCDCPMVRVNGREMYDCNGQWMTWEMGYWVHDPFFYMYDSREDEGPVPNEGPSRRIIKMDK